ncbi:hypothetical protein [Saccharothrix variisporea]|uniref:Uncharacterized protein n=1 Tax=Saccharothrix variisporea TaxID=543527 RepID=A0A495X571_9PSEU|nr:hypothetical protein [Saccharothrix variisporea]RKT69087.1 hypothetical protein DFJ66_2280 [Saccharothrix variisporea]
MADCGAAARVGGIRGRRARERGPALVVAAAVLLAGLGAVFVDEPAEVPGGQAQVSLNGNTWHMIAE